MSEELNERERRVVECFTSEREANKSRPAPAAPVAREVWSQEQVDAIKADAAALLPEFKSKPAAPSVDAGRVVEPRTFGDYVDLTFAENEELSARIAALEAQLADANERAIDYAERLGEIVGELAESREREGRMREAVRENHQWHLDYDDIDGYADSALCETNMAVLATENEKSAQLRLVGYVRTVDIEDLNEDRNLFVATECPFEDWTPLFYRPKEE